MAYEFGRVQMDVKAHGEDAMIEGYAAVFGNLDMGNHIIMPGAFATSLAKRPAEKVRLLFGHDPDKIIGKLTELREDTKGLFFKGQLITAVQRGRETYELLKAGAVNGVSIGYRTVKSEYDETADIRRLVEIDLWEVSVVPFPMNEQAGVTLVKGDHMPTEREFEQFLKRDAGFSAQQAKAIIADGYKATARDAGDDAGVSELLAELVAKIRG